MVDEQWHYVAYLLRLWWTGSDDDPVVRASLEDPHTGTRRGFGSFEHLVAFLQTQIGSDGQDDDATPPQ